MADTTLQELPPRARFVLRGDPARLGAGFGVVPPAVPLTSAAAGTRAALWLGPDEWLLLAEPDAAPPHDDAVEVSDGQCGYLLAGPGAALALNELCPLDLDIATFPPGACTRTLFGKLEITLWRRAEDRFEIEVARSLTAGFFRLMAAAIGDL